MSTPALAPIANRLNAVERQIDERFHVFETVVLQGNMPRDDESEARLSKIERDFQKEYRRVKKQRQFAREALDLRNRIVVVSHLWRVLSPASATVEELDQSVRYVIGSGSVPVTRVAKIVWAYCALAHWKKLDPSATLVFLMSIGLRQMREAALLERLAGPRGDLSKPATVAPNRVALVQELRRQLEKAPEQTRNEIALALGEWGGQEEADILRNRLLQETGDDDEMFKLNLISALANIGGPMVVETLLRLSETGANALATAALSSIEFISSGGSAALTESPEPPSIDTRALWLAYKNLAERLLSLSRSQRAQEYIRHSAAQLLQTIKPALRKMPAA